MWSEATSQAIHEIALDLWNAMGMPGAPDMETQILAYEQYKAWGLADCLYG